MQRMLMQRRCLFLLHNANEEHRPYVVFGVFLPQMESEFKANVSFFL